MKWIMMGTTARSYIRGLLGLLILFGLTIGLTALLVKPSGEDLLLMALYLLASGTITVLSAFATHKFGLPRRIGTIQSRLMLVSILATLLSLGSVGFVAFLMFISTHDLELLTGLLMYSLGLSVFFAVSLSDMVTRNIRELLAAVRRFGAGDIDIRVAGNPEGEIGQLAAEFNAMADRLQESFQRERDLEKARRDLVTMVSHDLRTPLASIRAMIEAINDGVVSDHETIGRYHRTIQSEIIGLSQLVSDLFELSQIDAGTLKLHIDQCPIDELISDAVDMMSPEAALRNLALTGEVDQPVFSVAVDPLKIQRVLYNLVQNAIRHTPPDGAISIRAEDAGAEIKVQVSDTGGGISTDNPNDLFENEVSSDRPASKASVGTGLGLRIAKGIVEAHGGHIWVESNSRQGSVFSFTLPKSPMPFQS